MSVYEKVQALGQGEEERKERGLSEDRIRLKNDLIESLGIDMVARIVATNDMDRARAELTAACERVLVGTGYDEVPLNLRQDLIDQVLDEVCGLGPLQPLLDDPSVTEIMVNGCASLYYERNGHLFAAEAVFETPEQIHTVIDRILAPLGRRLDASSPLVSARLANGDRVNAVTEPIAIDGPAVTIRRFSQKILSLANLVELGSMPPWYAQLLSWAVRARKSIAVAGGTGSGKTTLLNALSCEISFAERIITIEDAAELRFDAHPHVVSLEARDASIEGIGAVTIRELVVNALRMRPDRIVVGEVRGPETIDMLQAMNTGHDGSLTTLHAGSPDEAVLRLVLMARFGMDLPADIIEEQIATALDFIVMSRRLTNGSRVVSALTEVGLKPAGGVGLIPCVSYDLAGGSWHLEKEPSFLAAAVAEGTLDAKEVELWRQSLS